MYDLYVDRFYAQRVQKHLTRYYQLKLRYILIIF